MSISNEVARRRTFAIISHPDAGKTTLTEKLLLFAGAIQIAGSVKARKASRHASSDWMEIEKQRGISVASSVMQMEYRDCVINLLDTPGHQDFSEDTYRVLTAVDPVTADDIRAKVALDGTPEPWAALGEVYLVTGFFPEAEACLREAAALAPQSADVVFKHAYALEHLGRLEEAIAEYEAAVRLNHPRAADCWYYVGKNHLRREQAGPAMAAFEQARALPGARYELARLQARAGELALADAEARR